ncbi:MAG: transporter substrate-binding domain-containing protein, partial [Pseudogulbenkiania sp.]|nr:transporter substrate-binding domain-containing protein [Pseudogulbenkiania sp.]
MAGKLPISVTPLQLLPLKRALQQAEIQPNTLVLSLARTPEREAHYQWLSEVSPYTLWVYKASGRRLALRSPSDLAGKGLRIGVQDGANFHEWLKQRGIGAPPDNTVLDLVPQNELNFRKLQLGRIDLLAQPDVSFHYRVIKQGLRPAAFEPL